MTVLQGAYIEIREYIIKLLYYVRCTYERGVMVRHKLGTQEDLIQVPRKHATDVLNNKQRPSVPHT